MIRKSSHSKAGGDGKAVMTPLPISKNVLERIDALGPEMQPMQKYILIAGIMLDFYAKSSSFASSTGSPATRTGDGSSWYSCSSSSLGA